MKKGELIAEKYRIIRELGSGGEGTVYLGKHIMTDILRAIKLYRKAPENRSIHELGMLKRVHHASLPKIIDVLEENGDIYLVMEYVCGKSLTEYAGEKQTEDFCFSVAEQLLDVLEYLHTGDRSILHLDVKPSNILIRDNGHLVLLDFGAAMPVDLGKQSRQTCFGTPGYAAPEQFERNKILDERTDLYSFGATMFFLMTGEKYSEYSGNFWRMRGGWQRQIQKLIFPCLAKDPQMRPPHTADIRQKIRHFRRRKEYRKMCCQIVFAGILLAGVLSLVQKETRGLALSEEKRNQQYEALLSKAELSGLPLAEDFYKKAVLLCPERITVFQNVVERVGTDLTFTPQEEQLLQSLMCVSLPFEEKSVFEQFEQSEEQKEAYGKLCFELGILYWYFYEGTGGRTAAAAWFEKAVQVAGYAKDTDGWIQAAEIYSRIGGYYEKLGKKDITGESTVNPVVYWKDLSQLYRISAEEGKEGEMIRRNMAEEQLNLLIFEASSLKESGIQKEEVLLSIEEIQREGLDQVFPGRCEEAVNAVERAYGEDVNEKVQ